MCLNKCKSKAIDFDLFCACHGLAKVETWDHQEGLLETLLVPRICASGAATL